MFDPPYYLFEGVLPEEVITALLKDASDLKYFPGRVGTGQELKDRRSSLVGFFPRAHWIHGILFHYAELANSNSWKLPISTASPAQVAVYTGGSFFEWHSDNASPQTGDTLERKISVVLNVSSRSYSGGVLELQTAWDNFAPEPMRLAQHAKPGSVAAFPSVIPHRVTSVTEGERITLTSWILGPLVAAPT